MDRKDLIIGTTTKQYVASHKLSHVQEGTFYNAARQYFCKVCDYIIITFLLKLDVLQHAEVAKHQQQFEVESPTDGVSHVQMLPGT